MAGSATRKTTEKRRLQPLDRRSDSFLEQRRAELHSPLAKRWLEEIEKYLPEKPLSSEKKDWG